MEDEAARNEEGDGTTTPTTGINLNIGFEEWANYLRCPLCHHFALPPLTLCHNGHAICNSCQDMLSNKCGVCQRQLTGVKALFVENLLELCDVRCRYYEVGCGVWLNGRSLSAHQDICEYRYINCRTCGKLVDYRKFVEHMENEEKLKPQNRCYQGVYEVELVSDIQRGPDAFLAWEAIWLKAFDEDFFCYLQYYRSNFWVYVCAYASKEDCEKYCCSISLRNMNTTMEFKFVGKVNPLRADSDEVFNNGMCLVFPDIQLKNLLSNDGLHISVSIGIDRNYGRRTNLVEDGRTVEKEEATALATATPQIQLQRLPVVSVGNARGVIARITHQ